MVLFFLKTQVSGLLQIDSLNTTNIPPSGHFSRHLNDYPIPFCSWNIWQVSNLKKTVFLTIRNGRTPSTYHISVTIRQQYLSHLQGYQWTLLLPLSIHSVSIIPYQFICFLIKLYILILLSPSPHLFIWYHQVQYISKIPCQNYHLH